MKHELLTTRLNRSVLPKLILIFLFTWVTASGAKVMFAEEISFTSGEVKLAGTLLLPQGSGPFPAVIFLHGSGCSTRDEMYPIAEVLMKRGYAGLIFDKRGCGESEGEWTKASLLDLASDAEAALYFMRNRAEIDTTLIGLWGISQSGWVAPIAANRSGLAHFLIVITGGGASPRQVEEFGYGQRLKHRGFSLEAIPAARQLLDAYFAYLATGKERATLLEMIDRAKQESWYAALNLERVLPSNASRAAWEWVATYDPLPEIQKLRIPTLVLFGAQDNFTPTEMSMQTWVAGLQQAEISNSQVVIFPEAGHGLTIGGHHGSGHARQYVKGFPANVADWIETTFSVSR